MNVIETSGLCRVYGEGDRRIVAVDDVNLTVPHGQIVGLLGANGAGKTTLVKILSTLLLPSAGRAAVAGLDVARQARQVRRETSVVFGGDRGFYGRLSGRDNLRFFGMLRGLTRRELAARSDAVLSEVGLAEAADRRVETYSRGMRQRLHVAVGLIGTPKILLLDEPTIGLDPTEAERLRGAITALRDSGVTVLITSHQLLDIERLADRVVLLHRGRITHDLALSAFRRQARYVATVLVTGRGVPPEPAGNGDGRPSISAVTVNGDTWQASVQVPAWDQGTFHWLGEQLATKEVTDIDVQEVRLEDVYSQIVENLR